VLPIVLPTKSLAINIVTDVTGFTLVKLLIINSEGLGSRRDGSKRPEDVAVAASLKLSEV
jgi:hypothetical protein